MLTLVTLLCTCSDLKMQQHKMVHTIAKYKQSVLVGLIYRHRHSENNKITIISNFKKRLKNK